MELQYFGANSIKITTKKSVVSIDPESDVATIKSDLKKTNTVLATQPMYAAHVDENLFLVTGPGEYEFEDYSVKGIAAQPHTGTTGDISATVYRVIAADITLLVLGHVDAKLSEEQLEDIGMIDVVIVPVGGGGYTLDAVGAANIVRMIEPKMVIPVHSAEDGLSYSVPQGSVEDFIKELGVPVAEEAPEKYKVKTLPEQLTVQRISRS